MWVRVSVGVEGVSVQSSVASDVAVESKFLGWCPSMCA